MALAPRIALSLAIIAAVQIVGWPILNLLDRVAFGLAVAGVTP